ncbi:phosphocholine cytidylyltransferase family protein [Vallitalea okinawensis]|uniref:phosphocholine cytidylyltransferase family protein n=1 Tax=Vallitalea okinawensis TaxID=2078660 RepID=UPI000CFB7104|nr:NTP transferase domain-containing protein [Vallitalea okinawensis]
MSIPTTIVISCAGMGSRLGLGCPKSLVEIDGKPLIIRQLEMLQNYDDIRIVVGYQMEKVIEVVSLYRKDIVFAINNNYMNTGTGASFCIGAENSREYVVSLDGDLLVNPQDLQDVLKVKDEFICGTDPSTDNPVLMDTTQENGSLVVKEFSRERGQYEWTGLMKIKKEHISAVRGHVYTILEPLLPLPMKYIRTKEIDTLDDYDRAVEWVRNGYL